MKELPTDFNRVVWIFWLQGFDDAPDVVRLCERSWRLSNPTWRVIALSQDNLADYVDKETLDTLARLEISVVKLANLLRFYLIGRYGGVWADATVFCCKPLDSWLGDYMRSGFFAFKFDAAAWLNDNPSLIRSMFKVKKTERILCSWFLAAEKGNRLPNAFFEAHRDFFANNEFRMKGDARDRKRKMLAFLSRNPRLSQLWVSPVILRTFKVYPYFILHYHFASLVTHDPVCRKIWNETPTHSPRETFTLIWKLVAPLSDELRRTIDNSNAPMYKLTWKYKPGTSVEGCVLDLLMSRFPPPPRRDKGSVRETLTPLSTFIPVWTDRVRS
ncbi:MAG TPA: capsular polysaccharide synthesis protein [Gemmatimonadaceae bacterium]|nr:capsular polysaccharide synthesis protein [Gemmatimonadaceae bacterium]